MSLSSLLVDHLYDPYDGASDTDGHAQDGLRHVPRLHKNQVKISVSYVVKEEEIETSF